MEMSGRLLVEAHFGLVLRQPLVEGVLAGIQECWSKARDAGADFHRRSSVSSPQAKANKPNLPEFQNASRLHSCWVFLLV